MNSTAKLSIFLALIILIYGCKKNSHAPIAKHSAGKILSIAPDSGIVYGAITITGSNFDTIKADNNVQIGGVSGIINSITSTKMVVTIPNGAKTGKVTITNSGETTTSPGSFKVLSLVKLSSITNNASEIRCDRFGNLYTQSANSIFRIKNGSSQVIYSAQPNASIHSGSATTNTYFTLNSFAIDMVGNVCVALAVQTDVFFDNSGFPPTSQLALYVIKVRPDGSSSTISTDKIAYTWGSDMASDSLGNIYLGNIYNGVKKISPQGKGSIIDDFAVTNVAVDNAGNLYENDSNLFFRKINSQDGTALFIYPFSPGNKYASYYPMACDKWNNLFVENNGQLTIINTANYIANLNAPGQVPTSGVPRYPYSIAFGSNGHMYILSSGYLTEYAFK